MATIVSVQNMYNLVDRGAEALIDHCERDGIAFIPWIPLGSGSLSSAGRTARRRRLAPADHARAVAIAWLLERSPVMVPIPGTSSVAHLESNVGAAKVRLIDSDLDAIDDAVGGSIVDRGLRSMKQAAQPEDDADRRCACAIRWHRRDRGG